MNRYELMTIINWIQNENFVQQDTRNTIIVIINTY